MRAKSAWVGLPSQFDPLLEPLGVGCVRWSYPRAVACDGRSQIFLQLGFSELEQNYVRRVKDSKVPILRKIPCSKRAVLRVPGGHLGTYLPPCTLGFPGSPPYRPYRGVFSWKRHRTRGLVQFTTWAPVIPLIEGLHFEEPLELE